eukprot:CAMPEP_0206143598 /NCGR_PEP_ID=MMETSP1473-20131121/21126_1 /ASSEMBLY_ACC=CAM_ASM_001109 /TAXON_ID=1461547 /ORGANISM="Stichococcus sp, Strain RCC1054" /LENGTH=378 /DNA_ID=CAMNT_0053539075 /DNA_START=157 /DNA_END=1294 /DNA_ORIENTATION=-
MPGVSAQCSARLANSSPEGPQVPWGSPSSALLVLTRPLRTSKAHWDVLAKDAGHNAIAASTGKVETAAAATTAAYQGLPIFWQATVRLVGIVSVAVIASNFAIRLLNFAAVQFDKAADTAREEQTREGKERGILLRTVEAACKAAHKPVTLILPAAVLILALGETSRWLEVVVDLNDEHMSYYAGHVARWAIVALKQINHWALDASKVAIIVIGTWFSIAWKDLLVQAAIDSTRTDDKMDRILQPVGTLLGWALGAAGILNVLHAVGINIQPLLAAGGVSGIALGFGAQKLTQNVLSGAKLFLTQPFVVGERVDLLGGGGGVIVSGIVETVTPMNTIVRRDDGVPVLLPNSTAAECLVANSSRSKPPAAGKGPAASPA